MSSEGTWLGDQSSGAEELAKNMSIALAKFNKRPFIQLSDDELVAVDQIFSISRNPDHNQELKTLVIMKDKTTFYKYPWPIEKIVEYNRL